MRFNLNLLITVCIMSCCVVGQRQRRVYPRAATVAKCATKKGYYFCNHEDLSVDETVTKSYLGKGFCCPYRGFKSDERCANDPANGVECTLPAYYPQDQGMPLYMTYWVGQTPTQCNSTSHQLSASSDL